MKKAFILFIIIFISCTFFIVNKINGDEPKTAKISMQVYLQNGLGCSDININVSSTKEPSCIFQQNVSGLPSINDLKQFTAYSVDSTPGQDNYYYLSLKFGNNTYKTGVFKIPAQPGQVRIYIMGANGVHYFTFTHGTDTTMGPIGASAFN